MKPYKDYIGEHFLDRHIHITCECIIPVDITGLVVDYSYNGNELILHIERGGKVYKIGTNSTNTKIEEV